MSEAHRRKKNPDHVRAQLVAKATRLAVEQGLQGINVVEVSANAGVTRGAFFHHFANKQALVDAVFDSLLSEFDSQITERMSNDINPHGRFTRAYIEMSFAAYSDTSATALWKSAITDKDLREKWRVWMLSKVAEHSDTEKGTGLEAARFTADGVWLGSLLEISPADRDKLRNYLLDLVNAEICGMEK